MDPSMIAERLHPLEQVILPFLQEISDFDALVRKSKLKDVEVMSAVQWLSNKKLVDIHEKVRETVVLDENGKQYAKIGLPEMRFLKALLDGPLALDDIAKNAGLAKDEVGFCLGALKKKAAILMENKQISITDAGKQLLEKGSLEEKFIEKLAAQKELLLPELLDEETFALDAVKSRRQIVKLKSHKVRTITLTASGKEVAKLDLKIDPDLIVALTPELLKSGEWKNKTFRKYDVKINVPELGGGKRHFLRQADEYIRRTWLALGFEELRGPSVSTSYWNLDTLFVPQDHPARTMQDTFYIKEEKGKNILLGDLPKDFEAIKDVHENGGDTGSTGWRGTWSHDVAREVLLRTHTTVLSALQLHKLTEKDLPRKFFTVGSCFRNETVDWCHLFEFGQVEGIVVDKNVNFRHLLGYLKQFFAKMGFDKIRCRPGHFPYTEPSVEVDVFHPVKKEWIELGGAGIFRPEVTKPLLGEEVPVLAWGLGFGRMVTEFFKIKDLRELHKNDLKQLKEIKYWMR